MAVSLKTYRKITNGFARSQHFNLGILDFRAFSSNPIASYATGIVATPLLSMFCSSTTLPTKQIATNGLSLQYGIPAIKIAENINYGTWSVTFYGDELLLLRTLFLFWNEKIYDTKKKSFRLPGDYKSQFAFATVLSPQGVPTHGYFFRGLYPSVIQGITVSQSDSNVLQFTVDFEYDYFEVNSWEAMLTSYGMEKILAVASGQKLFNKTELNLPYGISFKVPF